METERWSRLIVAPRRVARAAARSMVRMDARRRGQDCEYVRLTAKAAGRAIRLEWWPRKVAGWWLGSDYTGNRSFCAARPVFAALARSS